MKLDLLYEIDTPFPWPDKPYPYDQRAAEQASYREALEQIQLADKVGFNTVWLVEHHFRENRSHLPSSEVVLGALSQITKNIRLGFGVTLAPHSFIHPARIAEKVATVDLLSGGRVEWGIGRSTPMEQAAFGVDREYSRKQMLAAAHTVSQMWEKRYYEEHSEFLDFPERMVTPKPYQDPHPPVWMAVTSEESANIAGSNGLGMLCFSPVQSLSKTVGQIDEYRRASANAKPLTNVTTNKVAGYTLVHCADSTEQAVANGAWGAVDWWYRGLIDFILKWEWSALMPKGDEAIADAFPMMSRPVEEYDNEDMIIVGDVDKCIRKMQKYADLGVDQLLCYVQFGKLPHEAVMRSIELLGKEVIPVMEKYQPKAR
jgi:alkanesulfonate monooxygenase SsuD/methylene tetrahydromethanopterin reductase-like flavin-dependent oxidoreductase (luciferase family)